MLRSPLTAHDTSAQRKPFHFLYSYFLLLHKWYDHRYLHVNDFGCWCAITYRLCDILSFIPFTESDLYPEIIKFWLTNLCLCRRRRRHRRPHIAAPSPSLWWMRFILNGEICLRIKKKKKEKKKFKASADGRFCVKKRKFYTKASEKIEEKTLQCDWDQMNTDRLVWSCCVLDKQKI